MKYLKIISISLVMLALPVLSWGEVYETKDAEGNVVFTDSPPMENAAEINLPQTNTADAPSQHSQTGEREAAQPAGSAAQTPAEVNNIVIQRDDDDVGVYEDGDYVDGVDQRELRRDEAVNRADPDAPHEVGDSEAQMPHEVGDSEAQMPHEVGDDRAETRAANRR